MLAFPLACISKLDAHSLSGTDDEARSESAASDIQLQNIQDLRATPTLRYSSAPAGHQRRMNARTTVDIYACRGLTAVQLLRGSTVTLAELKDTFSALANLTDIRPFARC
jgi:hypothetical protein